MLTLLSEIHFWSAQEDVIVKHTDYGSFKYYSKKEAIESLCQQSKKKYCELRGVIWNTPNKRPQKLRDRLKELEDYLLHNKVISFQWSDNQLQLLLSTGVLVNITINVKTGDVNAITFDKHLSSKLQVNILCDGIILGQQIICICNDGHVLGYGGPWKDGWILEGGPRRHLNFHSDWLAVWGKCEADHPQPWSPLGKDYQRANLHLYWIGTGNPELLAYKKTDGDPIDVIVSRKSVNPRTLIIIEQKVTLRGAVTVEISHFELSGSNLKRLSVTSVPLQTQTSCCSLSDNEDRLLIGCIDGSLALLDVNRGSTRTVKASFIPKFAKWHVDSALFVISNERGQLQYFDTALNSIKTQLIGEDYTPNALLDLGGFFNAQFTISTLSWGPKDLIVVLEQGPIVLISHVDRALSYNCLCRSYLRMGKYDKAIQLMLSWDFDEDSFSVLQQTVTCLLSKPMTEEIAKYLQDALGLYHSPAVPIGPELRCKFGAQVLSMTRRFFHQLVRNEMFETAFLLAVDLRHHDLFMDLHYIAVDIGETEMAAAARAQASSLLSRCSSEASEDCSRSSCSQCSDDSSANDNIMTTNFNNAHPKTYRSANIVGLPPPLPSFAPSRAMYVRAPQVPAHYVPRFAPPLPNLNHQYLLRPPLCGVTDKAVADSATAIKSPFDNPTPVNKSHFDSPPVNKSHFDNISAVNKSHFDSAAAVKPTFDNVAAAVRTPFDSPAVNKSHFDNISAVNKSIYDSAVDIRSPFDSSTVPIRTSYDNSSVIRPSFDNSAAAKSPYEHTVAGKSQFESPTAAAGKKAQPKVKFSDTVTAFIVPENRKPARPLAPPPLPLPPHLTDPQKELADSLPLCHPNEDYLKDFAPVRKDGGEVRAQPKIKVVHFGVV